MTGIANCTDLLRQMVAIPSDSGHEAAFAAFLEQFLREELEMRTELHHIEGGSCNVTGHWETGLPARRRLILGGHIDTVPPAAHWKTDPYQLTQQGDELHGLGAADMKGGLAAQLLVLKRLKEDRETLDVEFAFAGLADEERYSVGAHAYVEWTKNCRPPVQDTVFLMGEPHFDNIVIGAAGKVLLSLHIQGRKGHAAAPESGVNAIECMAALLEELKGLGYGIYLLSNATVRLPEYFDRIPGSQFFDGKIVSAEWKLLKPQHEIYETLFREYSLKPEECFFIDDLHINIEGALCVGMAGAIFYDDMVRLRRELNSAGVPVKTGQN